VIGNLVSIAVDLIDANPQQPRLEFDGEEIENLAGSIDAHGLIQPIQVHAVAGGRFVLHHGERRLRAIRFLGRDVVPAIVKDAVAGDEELLITALVENMQRVDMNPIEEANAIAQLKKHGRTQEGISRLLGISSVTVSSRLAWLDFDSEIQELVAKRLLPSDRKVSRAFAEIESVEGQLALARKLSGAGRTIRSIERAASIYARLERGEDVLGNYNIESTGEMQRKYQEKEAGQRRGKDRLAHAIFLVYEDVQMKLDDERLADKVTNAIQIVCRGCYLFEYDPDLPCQECPLTKFLLTVKEAKSNDGRN
jgi:ParB family chromosome partitioning protein